MTERTVPIVGMTCAACEDTVRAAVSALDGVSSVSASARRGTITISGRGVPSDAVISSALAHTPYSLGVAPWWSRDRNAWRDAAVGAALAALVGAVILWWEPASGLGQAVVGGGMAVALAALVLGLAASVSSCIATVGGLVLAISATQAGVGGFGLRKHVAFNLGRVVGFAILGGVAAAVGGVVALNSVAFAAVLILVALATGLLGLRLTELSPRVAGWRVSLPARWGRWASGDHATTRGTVGLAGLGAATFFLPCAFTQIAQILAFASGTPLVGAVTMGAFAVGTTPGLLALGLAAARSAGAAARRPMRVLGALMVGFAVVTLGGVVSGAGLFSLASGVPVERTDNVADGPGGQEVATSTVADGYLPRTTVVYAGEPITWTITPENLTCANLVNAEALGVGRITILADAVTVNFTLDEPGTYRFSCVMGMYQGSFVAIEAPDA